MSIAHIVAAGMGGIRTTGDLVAWMQLSRKMKIADAKTYVARKLGVELVDLTDEDKMRRLREDFGIGIITAVSASPKGMRAKIKTAELLDIEINSVRRFKSQVGL